MEYYGNNDWRDYKALQHHGILGMKWGKRNGPPYPLSGPAHSSSEKKAGWRKSLSSGSNSDDKVRKLKKKIDKNNAKIEKSQARLNSDKAKKRDEKVDKLEYKIGKHESNLAGKAIYYDAHKARTRHLESKKARADKKNAKDRYKIEKAENKNRKLEKKIEKIENKKLSEVSSNNSGKLDKFENPSGLSNSRVNELAGKAAKDGKFDIGFIEAVQNTALFYEGSNAQMAAEYKKYLKDPNNYWQKERYKLKDYEG